MTAMRWRRPVLWSAQWRRYCGRLRASARGTWASFCRLSSTSRCIRLPCPALGALQPLVASRVTASDCSKRSSLWGEGTSVSSLTISWWLRGPHSLQWPMSQRIRCHAAVVVAVARYIVSDALMQSVQLRPVQSGPHVVRRVVADAVTPRLAQRSVFVYERRAGRRSPDPSDARRSTTLALRG